MKRIVLGLVCGLTCALVSSRAHAQHGDSGTIEGAVFDQTGAPMKGVRVTISSDTQIGGKKVQYTSEEGSFRFSNLDAGMFDLRAEAPRLRTFIQKSIKVGINAPTEGSPTTARA
jgi:protocatechuate 3,4-dioxygenase beta subunit